MQALYVKNKKSKINEIIEIPNQIFNDIKKIFIKRMNSYDWLKQEIKKDNIEKVKNINFNITCRLLKVQYFINGKPF